MTRIILVFFVVLLSISSLRAQILEGVITGKDGAIPGATVQLLDSDFASVSDVNGKFKMEFVTPGAYQMEIRSVGYKFENKKIVVPQEGLSIDIRLQESSLTMDEVVVTGTMQPTFVSQSPVKVDVITSDYVNAFLPAAASSLVENVSLINGVQEVVACGVCFTNSISINGLPGPYTAVLMDGTPMYGNLASVYGLNGIPSMIIDRMEVIKGPSSTLYGSEAVAGVINIITKDPSEQPILEVDVMGTSHRELFGNLALAPKIGNSSGYIGINYAYINDFDDRNNDGFGDIINMDRISLFSKWDVARSSGKQLSISAKYYYEDRRNGVEEFLTDRNYRNLRGNDEIYGESIYTNRLELFGTYELPLVNNVKLDYSFSTHDQNSYYGSDFYEASQDIVFANLIWNNQYEKHAITGGLTNRYQKYDDNTVATENSDGSIPDKQYIPGVFVQDEWTFSNKFTLLAGTRLDHYQRHGVIFAPRLSTKFKPGEWTTLRTNFGTGFRIVNLFTEDHAFVTGQRDVIIEEELKPEESYNLSLNANHVYTVGNSQGMIDMDIFYTYFTNKITPDYDTPGQIIYSNISGHAVSKGIGLSIQHQFNFPVTFNIGFNVQDVTETEEGETRQIEFAPDWTGVFTASYNISKLGINIAYTTRMTGPMALPEVYDLDESGNPTGSSRPTSSDVFSINNLQVSKDFNQGITLYGGVQNIFNFIQPWSPLVGFNDPNSNAGFSDSFDTSYAYAPIHGREYYVGVRWSLGRN